MKKTYGFTLVEIMIVVAIIALLGAISIPNLLRTRINANEAAAQVTLKAIVSAETAYHSVNATYATIGQLAGENPPFMEDVSIGSRQGYNFNCPTVLPDSYSCTAEPAFCNITGIRNFTISTGGDITEGVCVPAGAGGGDDGGGGCCIIIVPPPPPPGGGGGGCVGWVCWIGGGGPIP